MLGVRLKLFILLIIAAYAAVFDARAALTPDESESRPTITEAYHHVAFTVKEGAPSGIWTIAQSTDGWLWLGCATGVYRFDGVSFERVELLSANSVESRSVRSVMASSNGGLWVVMASGRTAYLSDPIQPQPRWLIGLPAGERIDRMDEDASGDSWAFTASNKAFLVDGSTLHPPGTAWRYPEGEVKGALIDSDGNYWVRTAKTLGVLRKGSKVFEGTRVTDWPHDAELHTSQKGQLWFKPKHTTGWWPVPRSQEDPSRDPGGGTQMVAAC